MIVTITSHKGGVGKTTTAVHIAAYLSNLAPTLLLDGDSTRNATKWSQRGPGLPCRVASIDQAAKLGRDYKHIVIDTGQKPSMEDLKGAVDGCDLLIVPTVPSALDTDGLGDTLRDLLKLGATNYKVLFTKVAPDAIKEAIQLRTLLGQQKVPVFAGEIPRLKAYEKAAAVGTTAEHAEDRKSARAWEHYAAIGKEIA